jgi:hypothetical protein
LPSQTSIPASLGSTRGQGPAGSTRSHSGWAQGGSACHANQRAQSAAAMASAASGQASKRVPWDSCCSAAGNFQSRGWLRGGHAPKSSLHVWLAGRRRQCICAEAPLSLVPLRNLRAAGLALCRTREATLPTTLHSLLVTSSKRAAPLTSCLQLAQQALQGAILAQQAIPLLLQLLHMLALPAEHMPCHPPPLNTIRAPCRPFFSARKGTPGESSAAGRAGQGRRNGNICGSAGARAATARERRPRRAIPSSPVHSGPLRAWIGGVGM